MIFVFGVLVGFMNLSDRISPDEAFKLYLYIELIKTLVPVVQSYFFDRSYS
jgi:hypothetical protein